MAENRKTSAQVQAELDALIAERASLKAEIPVLEQQLRDKQRRYDRLSGGWNYPGDIGRKEGELESAKLWEQDADCPRVFYIGASNNPIVPDVVRKVTAKQIHVAERGDGRLSRFNRDGTRVGYGRDIDMDATFRGTKWEAELLQAAPVA